MTQIYENAEIDAVFPADEALVMKDAIERLFYMISIQIGNAIYPNERIRSHLWRLDAILLQDAMARIAKNANEIRNSSAYVCTVLFNTIMESGSDLIVDPYLNFLRNSRTEKGEIGGDTRADSTSGGYYGAFEGF